MAFLLNVLITSQSKPVFLEKIFVLLKTTLVAASGDLPSIR